MKLKKLGLFVIVILLTLSSVFLVSANATGIVHTITDTSELVGSNATIWADIKNNDTIDISNLEATGLGYLYVPESLSSLTIKGSSDKTYTSFYLICKNTINITFENINASSSSLQFPDDKQCTITLVGSNSFASTNNSKCVSGNIIFCGNGDLSLKSGQTTNDSTPAHCIYGNVIFDNSGTIIIASGDGKNGTSSSLNGINAGNAIEGNVECRNSGTIDIKAGNGGQAYSAYSDSSAYGDKGGNGGTAINGNLICTGNPTIKIIGGNGGTLSMRDTRYKEGTPGSGITGNVILKNKAIITIEGGKNPTTDHKCAYGVYGYLKIYNDASATIIGGSGSVGSYSKGGYGGIGILGSVELYDNAELICNGGDGSYGGSGVSAASYPYSFGNGGDGGIAILGDVYLNGKSVLFANGGNGGTGGSTYKSSSAPSYGISYGGDGGVAISGNITIGEGCVVIATGGNGEDGGRTGTSNGGNAGSGIVGNIVVEDNIKIIANPGNVGNKHYQSPNGSSGSKAYDIIIEDTPVLNGGYIDAIFYNSSKNQIIPINLNNDNLYLTKIIPNLNGDALINKSIKIISDTLTYPSTTNENGEIFCYLPSNEELMLHYGAYSAQLSYIWEDNSTNMFITLEHNDNLEQSIELTVTENIINEHVVFYVKSNEQITNEMLHIALYSESGQLVDYIIVPTIKPFTYTNVVFDDNKNAKTAKIFLWAGTNSITPLTEATEITLR